MRPSPPLRFLILLLAGWTGLRAILLAPPWRASPAEAGARPAEAAAERASRSIPPATKPPPSAAYVHGRAAATRRAPRQHQPGAAAKARPVPRLPLDLAWQLAPGRAIGPRPSPRSSPGAAPAAGSATASRGSLTAWSFLRGGEAAALAAGGLLGGSQAGARLTYRLNADPARPLALSARLTAPLRRPSGAEAALGLDWQPSRRLPVHLLAERRQKLGREGRSAFSLTLHGGVADAPLGRLRVDAYAQAGLVGTRSRDLFGDGALRVSLPLGPRIRAGAGAWAAAQPGLSRLDLGPQASFRLPLAGRTVTVTADWRQRLAGNARPGSGPALTIATDF